MLNESQNIPLFLEPIKTLNYYNNIQYIIR